MDLAGSAAAERRLQRGGRPPVDRIRLRADSLRRDAARRLGRERARRRHGSRRRVGVAVLPVVPARLRRPAAHVVARLRRARARSRCARTTTGTSRRGAARIPIASSRTRSPTCAIPRSRPPRSAATPSAASRRSLLRSARQARPADDPLRPLGSVVRRVRGDRHRAVPARRLLGHVADHLADAPPEIPAVLFGAYGMYTAVDWLYSKVPVRFPDIRSASPKAASDGWPASSTGSTTATGTSSATCRRGATSTRRPSEVLRRNFWFCALDDDVGHARPRSHRRRPHPRRVRLPPRRLVVAGHAGDARPPAPRPRRARRRRPPHHLAATRPSCSGTRSRRPRR